MPPAPISGRLGAASAWTGSEVVIAAGVTRNEGRAKAVNDGAAFNPAHGTWRTIAPAPAAGPVLASTWTGRELFALVGDVASERPLRTLFYRPEDDTWREVAGSSPLSFPVGTATWTGDRVVVVAGGPTPAVYTLDPTTGAWRRLETDITLPDNGIVATATGAVVIATGTVDGCAASSNPCAVERHLVMILIDPAAATVRAIDPGPLSVPAVGLPGPAVAAMVTDQEGVLVLAVDRTVQRPELATGTWRQVGPAGCSPSPEVAGLTPIWTGERLVVVCSPTQADALDPRRQVWVPMTVRGTPPTPTMEPVIVWAGDRLLIWSGVLSVQLSPTSDQGTTFTPAPQ